VPYPLSAGLVTYHQAGRRHSLPRRPNGLPPRGHELGDQVPELIPLSERRCVVFWSALQAVFGRAFADTVIAAFKARPAGPLVSATAKFRLSKDAAYNPTPDSTIAGLAANEADYSGYTAGGETVVLSAAVNLSSIGVGALATQLFEATVAGPFVPANVYGWWIDDGTNVIAAEAFPVGTVATFASPGDFLDLTAVLPVRFYQSTS
jgi:hypothetical protein